MNDQGGAFRGGDDAPPSSGRTSKSRRRPTWLAALSPRRNRPPQDASRDPPPPAAAEPCAGACDGLDGDELYGWAWRPASPQSRVEVELWVDGVVTAQAAADLDRPDVRRAGVGDGRYGWRLPLALDPASASAHKIEVRCRTGEALANGVLHLDASALAKAQLDGAAGSDIVGLLDVQSDGWFNRRSGELAPGFPVSAGDVVVDVGSGDGGMAGFCARAGADVILVDRDPARLDRALETVRRQAVGEAEARMGDAGALPLADGAATRVICTEVLEHVDDPAAVLAELVRVGRPGALYLLSVPGAASEQLQTQLAPPAYFQKPNHIRIFQDDDLARLAEDAGLVVERRSRYGFYWTLWWVFFWQAGVELGEGSHPLLEAWSHTWRELLKSPDAARIKGVLDGLAAKSQVVVARKPG